MSFQDNLATMPAIDHLSGLDILDKEDNVVHHIPNAPGKQGSLKLYHAWRKSLTASWTQRQQNAVWHGLPSMLPMPKPIRANIRILICCLK